MFHRNLNPGLYSHARRAASYAERSPKGPTRLISNLYLFELASESLGSDGDGVAPLRETNSCSAGSVGASRCLF
jgi:hypothetical protein